jgi:hypothetical protein
MKENKRKQKSESFDQGKFVPNVLDKVYSQLGISANQEKVSPEDEQRILSLFAKEADAFVPNVLPAVKAKAHVIAPEDRIDPAAEAKIIGMLAAEASAFVPNVLPAVAKAEKIELAQEKLSPLEEKKVVKAIQKEASVFVPNDLSALEQICGTVKVNETQEALELNEKMKNEAGAFLAPSENRVYAQAGLKKRGFFAWLLSTKGIAISSGVVAATAAAVTLAIVLNTGSSATLLPAAGAVTVVNVAVTPASATRPQPPPAESKPFLRRRLPPRARTPILRKLRIKSMPKDSRIRPLSLRRTIRELSHSLPQAIPKPRLSRLRFFPAPIRRATSKPKMRRRIT